MTHLFMRYGAAASMGPLIVLTLTIASVRFSGADVGHAGVTSAVPGIFAYTIVIVIAVFVAIATPKDVPGWLWFNVLAFFAIGIVWSLLFWTESPLITSGQLHYSLAVAMWIVAAPIASSPSKNRDRLMLAAVVLVILIETLFSIAQLIGLTPDFFGHAASGAGFPRAVGTLGHPGTLAKVMVFLALITLPMTRSIEQGVRRWAWVSLLGIAMVTGLTIGRANVVALVVTIALWFVLDPGLRLGAKVRGVILVTLVVAPFVQALLARSEDDPDGGERPYLLVEAAQQLSQTLWTGTGPNSYVETVGQFGPATALGFPVHNAFVLLLAELGLPLAVLFTIPLVVVLFSSLRVVLRRSRDPYALSLLAGTPGMIVTATTGWGALASPMLYLWIFVVAYLYLASRAAVGGARELVGSGAREVNAQRASDHFGRLGVDPQIGGRGCPDGAVRSKTGISRTAVIKTVRSEGPQSSSEGMV